MVSFIQAWSAKGVKIEAVFAESRTGEPSEPVAGMIQYQLGGVDPILETYGPPEGDVPWFQRWLVSRRFW